MIVSFFYACNSRILNKRVGQKSTKLTKISLHFNPFGADLQRNKLQHILEHLQLFLKVSSLKYFTI